MPKAPVKAIPVGLTLASAEVPSFPRAPVKVCPVTSATDTASTSPSALVKDCPVGVTFASAGSD